MMRSRYRPEATRSQPSNRAMTKDAYPILGREGASCTPPTEVVASFRVYRRDVPRLRGTPRTADDRSAVRKMSGLLGEPVGRNAHNHGMFGACAPEVCALCSRAFSLYSA